MDQGCRSCKIAFLADDRSINEPQPGHPVCDAAPCASRVREEHSISPERMKLQKASAPSPRTSRTARSRIRYCLHRLLQ
jgi:hypothetical protein